MSAKTRRNDREPTEAQPNNSPEEAGRPGYAVVLRHAHPDVEPERAARWAVRAGEEGML